MVVQSITGPALIAARSIEGPQSSPSGSRPAPVLTEACRATGSSQPALSGKIDVSSRPGVLRTWAQASCRRPVLLRHIRRSDRRPFNPGPAADSLILAPLGRRRPGLSSAPKRTLS